MIINKVIQKSELMWHIIPAHDNIHLLRYDGYDRKNNDDIIVDKYEYKLKYDYDGTAPEFLYLNDGVIVMSAKWKGSDFWWALNYSGEMLPIKIQGLKEKYFLCNITYCPNAVNYKESIFEEEDEYEERKFIHMVLKPERIGGNLNVFKLENDASSCIYAISDKAIGRDLTKEVKKANIAVITFAPIISYRVEQRGATNEVDYFLEKDYQNK